MECPVDRPSCERPIGFRQLVFDKGLIGFDVGTGSDIVRPELLRLVNRGTQTTAEKQQFALAA